MWQQFRMMFHTLLKGKTSVVVVQDVKLKELIERKTGVIINKFLIAQYERPFGAMFGIPGNPQLYLSKGLYERFTPNEIEYVVLHETGHYVLIHTLVEAFSLLLLTVFGVLLLKELNGVNGVIIAALFGAVFGVIMVRITRLFEYQADNYAVARMDNPNGMITATEKFRFVYKNEKSKKKIIEELFYRGSPYKKRIQTAESEIEKRKLGKS